MSIRQNFPTTQPSLVLDFANSKTLDPRITFSRTNPTATYMNENGLIVTAAADEPRFDHKIENGVVKSLGLLVEEQRQNLVFYNTKHDEGYWVNTNTSETINTTETLSPDGTNNATKLFGDNGATTRQSIYQGVGITSGTTYTFSVFLKQGERRYATMWFDKPTISEGAYYGSATIIDLQTGTLATGNQTNIIPYPNGWYRCYVTATPTVTETVNMQVSVGGPNNNSGAPYDVTGDGSSGIYIWGHQLEAGAFPTSYIPTEGSQATRSPDNVTMTGTNFSDWFNSSEGTLVTQSSMSSDRTYSGTFRARAQIIKSSSYNTDSIFQYVTSFGLNATAIRVSNSSIFEITSGSYSIGTKIASAYSVGSYAVSAKGLTPTTDSYSGIPSGLDKLIIGNVGDNNKSGCINEHISKLTYYPVRLTNTQLQNITK